MGSQRLFDCQISINAGKLEDAVSKAQGTSAKAIEIGGTVSNEFKGAGGMLSNLLGGLTKDLEANGASFAKLGATINKGKELMINKDLAQAKLAAAIDIPKNYDKNDPVNIEHRKFNDYLVEQINDGQGVTSGSKDTQESEADTRSRIGSQRTMANVNNNHPQETPSRYDESLSISSQQTLGDQFGPGGTEEQVLNDATSVITSELRDNLRPGGEQQVVYDDNSSVIRTDLRDIVREGGTEEQNYNDSSSVTGTLLTDINNDLGDQLQELNSNSNIKSQQRLANMSRGSSGVTDTLLDGINVDALDDATTILKDLGEVGDEQDIMGNELSKAVDDLGISDLGVTDIAQNIAAETVINEVGK